MPGRGLSTKKDNITPDSIVFIFDLSGQFGLGRNAYNMADQVSSKNSVLHWTLKFLSSGVGSRGGA